MTMLELLSNRAIWTLIWLALGTLYALFTFPKWGKSLPAAVMWLIVQVVGSIMLQPDMGGEGYFIVAVMSFSLPSAVVNGLEAFYRLLKGVDN